MLVSEAQISEFQISCLDLKFTSSRLVFSLPLGRDLFTALTPCHIPVYYIFPSHAVYWLISDDLIRNFVIPGVIHHNNPPSLRGYLLGIGDAGMGGILAWDRRWWHGWFELLYGVGYLLAIGDAGMSGLSYGTGYFLATGDAGLSGLSYGTGYFLAIGDAGMGGLSYGTGYFLAIGDAGMGGLSYGTRYLLAIGDGGMGGLSYCTGYLPAIGDAGMGGLSYCTGWGTCLR